MARRRKKTFDLSLSPETRRGAAIVLLFALALLLFLGRFDLAGSFGKALDDGISYVFGWNMFVIPFILIAWGYHILSPQRLPMRFSNVLGFLLLFISLNPLIHLITFPGGGMIPDAALRVAGGRLGQQIAITLTQNLGLAGSLLATASVFVISLLLVFNATLEDLRALRWSGCSSFARKASLAVKKDSLATSACWLESSIA